MGIVLAILVTLALGVPAQPAGAAVPSSPPELQCGVPVTTSVQLSADLTCSERIVIPPDAPPVTIDLNGHTLRVDPVPDCVGRNSGYPQCTVTDMSTHATVENGTVDGTAGSVSGFGAGLTISKVHVTGLVNTGFYGAVTLDHSVVDGGVVQNHHASIHSSTITGGINIADADAGTPIDIVGNHIVGGISILDSFDFDRVGGVIARNRIEGSTGPGISISGIGTGSMGRLEIRDNTIVGNAGDGISYQQDIRYCCRYPNGPITVSRNVMRDNGGHGFEAVETLRHGAVSGLVDGSGNRARGNALDPQCTIIRCGPTDTREIPFVSWDVPPNVPADGALGPDHLDATSPVSGTFIYAPPAGTVLAPGPWNLAVHFVPDDPVRYQPVDRAVTVFVDAPVPTNPVITWPAPDPIVFDAPLGPDELDATASVPGAFVYTPAAGTVLTVGSHELSVTFTPTDLIHYNKVSATTTLEVLPPATESVSWSDPAPIPYGTPLGPDQLNAVASVPGMIVYRPAAGTVLMPGPHALIADFTPDDPVTYSPIETVVQVDVSPPAETPPTTTFAPALDIPRGGFNVPNDVDLADIDGDGVLDVITSQPGLFNIPGNVRVSFGAGDGTFPTAGDRTIEVGPGGHTVAASDVDADGDVDLVVANGGARTISTLLNEGDGTFAPAVERAAGNGQGDIQLVDLDGDGILDVVESNFVGGTVSVLLGHGDGTFADPITTRAGALPVKFATADVNRDGDLDLVVPDVLTNIVSVLLGNGDGTFQARRTVLVGLNPTSVALADLDGDGLLDLASTNQGDSTLSVLHGDGTGGFGGRLDYSSATGPRAVRAGDMNGDGIVDLVTANDSGTLGVWLGTGDGTLSPRIDREIGPEGRALALGDLDGDGQLDAVVARPFQLQVTVILNRTQTPSP